MDLVPDHAFFRFANLSIGSTVASDPVIQRVIGLRFTPMPLSLNSSPARTSYVSPIENYGSSVPAANLRRLDYLQNGADPGISGVSERTILAQSGTGPHIVSGDGGLLYLLQLLFPEPSVAGISVTFQDRQFG